MGSLAPLEVQDVDGNDSGSFIHPTSDEANGALISLSSIIDNYPEISDSWLDVSRHRLRRSSKYPQSRISSRVRAVVFIAKHHTLLQPASYARASLHLHPSFWRALIHTFSERLDEGPNCFYTAWWHEAEAKYLKDGRHKDGRPGWDQMRSEGGWWHDWRVITKSP